MDYRKLSNEELRSKADKLDENVKSGASSFSWQIANWIMIAREALCRLEPQGDGEHSFEATTKEMRRLAGIIVGAALRGSENDPGEAEYALANLVKSNIDYIESLAQSNAQLKQRLAEKEGELKNANAKIDGWIRRALEAENELVKPPAIELESEDLH